MEHKIQSVVCIDCETGGLSPTKNNICSVAVSSFSLKDGVEISKFETFVQPYSDLTYEDEAMEFTGITYAQLQGGLPIKEVVNELCSQFQLANTTRSYTKKPALLGHHILFDIGFITKAFLHCRVDIGKYLDCKPDGNGNLIPAHYDTMWLSRMRWGGDETMGKFNLEACCNKANVALSDAHNAMNDVVATKELFMFFMNGLRSGSGGEVSGSSIIKNRPRKYFQF